MTIFTPKAKEFYRIIVDGIVFSKANRFYETEDEKEIEKLMKCKALKVVIDSIGETINLSSMNLKELSKKAKEFGISTEVTAENKNAIINEIIRKMGA